MKNITAHKIKPFLHFFNNIKEYFKNKSKISITKNIIINSIAWLRNYSSGHAEPWQLRAAWFAFIDNLQNSHGREAQESTKPDFSHLIDFVNETISNDIVNDLQNLINAEEPRIFSCGSKYEDEKNSSNPPRLPVEKKVTG